MRSCSAVHTDSPWLCCDRESGHRGWHRDTTYGDWLSLRIDDGDPVGVLMRTRGMVRRFNEAVHGYYDTPSTCTGVLATADREGVVLAGEDANQLQKRRRVDGVEVS